MDRVLLHSSPPPCAWCWCSSESHSSELFLFLSIQNKKKQEHKASLSVRSEYISRFFSSPLTPFPEGLRSFALYSILKCTFKENKNQIKYYSCASHLFVQCVIQIYINLCDSFSHISLCDATFIKKHCFGSLFCFSWWKGFSQWVTPDMYVNRWSQ